MKPKTIEVIKEEVAREYGFESWFHVLSKRLFRLEDVDKLINEVCNRRAIEVAKASLEKASENALMRIEGHGKRYYTTGDPIDIESIERGIISIEKSSITDEQNIVL